MAHKSLLVKIRVTWLDLLRIGEAMPLALGINLFKVGPLSTRTLFTSRFSLEILKLCFALATADFKSLKTGLAALFGKLERITSASSADLPRIAPTTNLTFLGDILKYLKCAFISIVIF